MALGVSRWSPVWGYLQFPPMGFGLEEDPGIRLDLGDGETFLDLGAEPEAVIELGDGETMLDLGEKGTRLGTGGLPA